MGVEEITLENLKYLYNNSVPDFVNKAEYSPNEYELSKYIYDITDRDRKNPFVQKQFN